VIARIAEPLFRTPRGAPPSAGACSGPGLAVPGPDRIFGGALTAYRVLVCSQGIERGLR
jgi:hypothetical protein